MKKLLGILSMCMALAATTAHGQATPPDTILGTSTNGGDVVIRTGPYPGNAATELRLKPSGAAFLAGAQITGLFPGGGGAVSVSSGKTFTVTNTITLSGTDGTTMTFPATSATIARTDASNTFTGHQTIEGVTSTGATGTGNFVFDTSPTLVTPNIGVATGTSLTLPLGSALAPSFALPHSGWYEINAGGGLPALEVQGSELMYVTPNKVQSIGQYGFGYGLAGIANPTGVLNVSAFRDSDGDAPGAFSVAGHSITLVNGVNSNIAIVDGTGGNIQVTGPTGAFAIGGISWFSGTQTDGQVMWIFNDTTQAMTITNADASSLAANQIETLTGSDVVLSAGHSFAQLVYNGTTSTWWLIGHS